MTQIENEQSDSSANKEKLTVSRCFTCHHLSRKYWISGCGIFFLLLAIIVGVFWTTGIKMFLQYNLQVKPGRLGYNNWVDIPAPIYMKIYMFNWTNPEDIYKENYKPILVEMGPYVFLEKHTRQNVTFNQEKDTVSFDQIRTWHFLEDMSSGSLDDNVTNVNVVAATTAYTLRSSYFVKKYGTSLGMQVLRVKIAITKTVRELLFDGYSDPFLTIVKKLRIPDAPPFEKFGWLVDRNGSSTYDGHFEMRSGQNDITQMGKLTHWNYVNKTKFYRDECSEVKGTTAELWPMEMDPVEDVSIFVTDLCRPITLKYQDDYNHFGVIGSRWVGDYRVFDNGEKYPPNKCYCTGDHCPDLMAGVHNMSQCRFGAPIFASCPHFYLADEHYLKAVIGLNPDKEKHEFNLALVPSTGTTLRIEAKLQINTLIQKVPGLKVLGDIPKLMIPAFWMAQTLEIDEKLASQAKLAALLPSIGLYVALGISGIAAILAIFGIICAGGPGKLISPLQKSRMKVKLDSNQIF